MDQAIAVLTAMVERDARILKDPEPLIAGSQLAKSSVNILVCVWVGKNDHWTVRLKTTKAIKDSLDAAGIGIPFPCRTVYMVSDKD
jgi:small conductance mechanosensitive channel